MSRTEPERRGRTRVAAQRWLSWAEWGPEDGAAVLFCPGAGTSCALGFGEDVVAELGVRLIALDRPGLGGSDPDPDRTLTSWSDDVIALVAARGIRAPRVVGFSQGAPFALACAAAGHVSRVALVSGSDELASDHLRPLLVPDVAALVDQVRCDAKGAEAFFAQMGARTLRSMILSMSGEADRAVYGDPAFDAALTRALDEAFANGSAGYARDTALAMSAWPFDLSAIATPIDLWYGALDTSPVHSPDLGRCLTARLPNARRHLEPDAGGALLWTHAEQILRALLSGD